MKEYLFFRYWLRSFSPLSLRQNRLYPLVRVCENYNEHCPVKTDPDSQELTAACGLSQRAPAQTWDSLMPLNFSKTTCTRQMSVWQPFLKIQSAAWLTVLLQASRAPPAQALTAEGRSWPWAWSWARRGRGRGHGQGRGRLITGRHRIRARPSSRRFWLPFPHPLLTVCSPPQYYQLRLLGDSGRRQSGTEDTNEL